MYIYQEKTSGWLIFLRVVFTFAVLYSISFIFGNSMQIADQSAAQSQGITALYNQFAAAHGLPILTEHLIRKLAHVAEYAMLGFFLMLCLRVYTGHFVRHISWPLFLGLLTAVTDETIQTRFVGRSAELRDVWIDSFGLCLGIGGAFTLLLLLRFIHWVIYGSKKRTFHTLEEIEEFEEEQQR